MKYLGLAALLFVPGVNAKRIKAKDRVCIEEREHLSFKDGNLETDELLELCSEEGLEKYPLDYLAVVSEARDDDGELLFSFEDMKGMQWGGATAESLRYYTSLKNKEGGMLFYSIADELDLGLLSPHYFLRMFPFERFDLEAAESLVEIREQLTDEELRRYLLYGLSAEDVVGFNDTDKPNAIYVQALYTDTPIEMGIDAFLRNGNANFIHNLGKEYDLVFRIVSTPEEVYHTLDLVSDPDLVVFGGHGAFKTDFECLVLSEGNVLCSGDYEIAKRLRLSFSPDTTYAVLACGSAMYPTSFARFIDNHTDGLVFGVRETFSPDFMDVHSFYPLDLTFYSKVKKDITFRSDQE